jgi:hypothetical protein
VHSKGDAGSDASSSEAGDSNVGRPDGPVIDTVLLPQAATIDSATNTAAVDGAVTFHDNTSQVTTLKIVVHSPAGTFPYTFAFGGPSPQPLHLEFMQTGTIAVDLSLVDQAGLESVPYTQAIVVSQ